MWEVSKATSTSSTPKHVMYRKKSKRVTIKMGAEARVNFMWSLFIVYNENVSKVAYRSEILELVEAERRLGRLLGQSW